MFLFNLLRSGQSFSSIIINVLALAIAVMFAIMLHECAHGVVAGWCGDKTAKYAGRITLNPVKHIDWIGLLMLVFVGFGWAKPVPIDSGNFKNRRKGMIYTSIAGVVTNLSIASIALLLVFLLKGVLFMPSSTVFVHVIKEFFVKLLTYTVSINMMLALFNLLPIYPLDGFRLLNEFLPYGNKFSAFMYRYGSFVLLGLLIFSSFADVIGLWFLDIFGLFSNLISRLLSMVLIA